MYLLIYFDEYNGIKEDEEMLNKFMGLDKIVRLILLFVPFVNWITELVIRWSIVLEKKDVTSIVIAVLATIPFTGFFVGWIDFFYTLLKDKLAFLDVQISTK